MWPIADLEGVGLDFSPERNSFTYTFPPPYIAKRGGEIRHPISFQSVSGWSDLSLYLHIPFCHIDCSFCSLHHQVARDDNLVSLYLNALQKEIQSYKNILTNIPVIAIFFGGGTPSILSSFQINQLLDEIGTSFHLADSVEVCIECAPGVHRTRGEWESFLRDLSTRSLLPLSRVSFGVQSFDEQTLQDMGRQGGIRAALDLIHAVDAVVPVYNIDIILGYPGQPQGFSLTEAAIKSVSSIEELLSSGIRLPSLSLYQLWDTETIRIGRHSKYPEKEIVLAAKWFLQEKLYELGYKPSVISALIRDDKFEHVWARHRHVDFRHIGMGSGIYSILPRELVQRPRDINGYIRLFDASDSLDCTDVCYSLNEEEILIRQIIMGLRSYHWVNVPEATNRRKEYSQLNEVIERTSRLVNAGLIEFHDNRIKLTRESFMIANEISSYLHPSHYPRKS